MTSGLTRGRSMVGVEVGRDLQLNHCVSEPEVFRLEEDFALGSEFAITADMSSLSCVLRRSSRICTVSARMNRAGSLRGAGMFRSTATSLENDTGAPWMVCDSCLS